MPAAKTAIESFTEKYIPEPNSGCFLWMGAINNRGYGTLAAGGYKGYAHRLAWILANGPIPAGLDICHKCDVPCCVNPNHLFVGTASENAFDMVRKGRHPTRTHPERIARGLRNGTHTKPASRRIGTDNGESKLNDDLVRRIKASALSATELARLFNVSPSAVRFVRQGKTWTHVL